MDGVRGRQNKPLSNQWLPPWGVNLHAPQTLEAFEQEGIESARARAIPDDYNPDNDLALQTLYIRCATLRAQVHQRQVLNHGPSSSATPWAISKTARRPSMTCFGDARKSPSIST